MQGNFGDVSSAGEIDITFVEARKLVSTSKFSTMSPFARVELEVGARFNTASAHKGGVTPTWDQKATLPTKNASTANMEIHVRAKAMLGGSSMLGRFQTPVQQ
jgi:hypothetical protein